jgi:hypothetical protein
MRSYKLKRPQIKIQMKNKNNNRAKMNRRTLICRMRYPITMMMRRKTLE